MLTMYTLPYNSFFFFFNDTATTEIYTLSLHDALPILVLTRQAVKRQRLVDVLFDPAGELRILRRPLGEPSGQIAARLGEIAAIPRVRLRRPEDKLQASAAPAGNHRRPRAARKPRPSRRKA